MGIYEVLQQGATENRQENGLPAAQVIALNLACPICDVQSKGMVEAPLYQNPGARGIQCGNGHKFNDTEQLNSMYPKPLKNPPPPRVAPQQGHTSMAILVPEDVQKRLADRFGQRRDATIAAVCRVLTEMDTYVVSADDSKRISELFLKKVTSANELYGLIFSLKSEKQDLEKQVEVLRLSQSNPSAKSGDGITLNLDSDLLLKARQKAAFNNKPLEQWLRENFIVALQNDWF